MRLPPRFRAESPTQTRSLRTDPIDDVGQRAFVSLAADEKSVAAEVIDGGLLATQLAVLAISSTPIPWRPRSAEQL